MDKKITIYSSEHCVYCNRLKVFLEEKGVPFTSLDVNKPEVAKYLEDRNIQGVPFTIIENLETGNKEEIHGFNQLRFLALFG